MSSEEVKTQVRNVVEDGIDKLHQVADVVTAPLAPVDGAFHGLGRGLCNWITDTHPEDRTNKKPGGHEQKQGSRGCGGGGGGGATAFNINGNQQIGKGSNVNAGQQRDVSNFGNN